MWASRVYTFDHTGPELVFMDCAGCGGTGKVMLYTATATLETAIGYEHDCCSCYGTGRVLDLGETIKGATDAS